MPCSLYLLCVFVYSVFFAGVSSTGINGTSSSFPRTSYTYYLDSGLPSTWLTNSSVVVMDGGGKMRVIMLIQNYNRNIGFYCGLYSAAGDSYSFSIVAIGEKSQDHDVVWSTERGRSVGEDSMLQLRRDGGLVLQDSDGASVWSTGVEPVEGMNLTDSGELVLFGGNGTALWRSFDHPSDTLLVGQRLYEGRNLSTGPFFATLVSEANFSAFFNAGNGRSMMYYELGLNTERNRFGLQYREADRKGFIENVGTLKDSYPLEYIEFVKLGQDGHLKACSYHALSGSGRKVDDMVTTQCQDSPDAYLLDEVRNLTYSASNNGDVAISSIRTVNECQKACLNICSCSTIVFRYDDNNDGDSDGKCYMPSEIYSTTNQNNTDQSRSIAFVKALNPNGAPSQTSSLSSSSSWAARHRKALAGILSAGGVTGIFVILVCFVIWRKNHKTDEDIDGDANLKLVTGMPLRFSYKTLETATENFKETLGSGGFGSVFKGVLEDGTRIAVKRLDKLSQGMREFLAEVETIGSLHHFNLVRLVGFCAEKSCRLLVYEYMSNRSLDTWIFSRNNEDRSLDWETRKKIVLGVAKGLTYLHEECRHKIIHLDIKPHNILLDENFNAKVSDFGLSTLIGRDESQVLTKMRGTPGYLAPEWKELQVTVKVDVYSFGIVLLEIVSKRKNVESSRSETSFHLLRMLQNKARADRIVEIVESLDEDMEKNLEEVERMIRIGAWCLQDDPEKRPAMSTVVKALEGVMEVDPNVRFNFSHAMMRASVPGSNDHITVAPQASFLSAPR